MKKIQLLAAALLFSGAAFAQTTPNAKPAAQGRTAGIRALPSNVQISATSRNNVLVDNDSYLQQVGSGNYGSVSQIGSDHSADMYQNGTGNDAYQTQRGLFPVGGGNVAYSSQYGTRNYVDQDQNGYRQEAIVEQGAAGANVTENYAVQDQDGDFNYGFIDQDSDRNFAHQKQTNAAFSGAGNFADTRQGNGPAGSGNADRQWSQVVQNGNGNAAIVRQDHD
ncbi:hypothetical protein [Hymenobacter latericus]|uniref:hypothetical protein n=1 Tax=Hymenobacter sp. YIM 151858-1 TaxID=2987688 RepID=UPI002226FCA0|nr:hypothetical protein [Hymenobacter sp. YIM 151858-1]UYZ59614.1 hypothetical protein OIS50_02175 [Hymenobacter sp. YIM 151858-1]